MCSRFLVFILAFATVQSIYGQSEMKVINPFSILQIGDSHLDIGVFPAVVRRELILDSAQLNAAWLFPDFLIKPHYSFPFKLKNKGVWFERNLRNHKDLGSEIGLFGRLFFLESKKATWKLKGENIHSIEFIHPVLASSCKISAKNGTVETHQIGESNLAITRISVDSIEVKKVRIRFEKDKQDNLEIYAFRINPRIEPSSEYQCFGLSGGKFSQFWEQNDVLQAQLKSLNPTLFCIALGTNDSYFQDLDTLTYKANLSEFLQKIHAGDSTMKILVSTPPFTRYEGRKPVHEAFINQIIREVAEEQNLLLWDLFAEMTNGKNDWKKLDLYYSDGLHFTDKGYEIQALLFLRFLANQKGEFEKVLLYENKIQVLESRFKF